MNGDLIIPTTISKRGDAWSGPVARGTRQGVVAKAAPVFPKGPAIKAPTLARTGPKVGKGILVPKPLSPLAALQPVGKGDIPVRARRRAAVKGDALPGGKFPIRNAKDLRDAKEDLHFVHGKEHSAAERLIARRGSQLSKAARSYDPEERRQRRLGAAAAGSALGGGHLVRTGGRRIQKDTRSLRTVESHADKLDSGAGSSQYGRALLDTASRTRGSALVNRGAAGRVAAGAGLLGGAAALMSDRHKRKWR